MSAEGRRTGRPMGEVSRALLTAASVAPGTVLELAQRAGLDVASARFKAKDLVRMGALQPHAHTRPRVLAARPAADARASGFALLERAFWGRAA